MQERDVYTFTKMTIDIFKIYTQLGGSSPSKRKDQPTTRLSYRSRHSAEKIDPSPLRIQRSIDTGAFRPPVNIWIGRISAQKEAKRARGGPGFRAECSYYSTLARHARLAARLPAMLKPGLTVINMRLEVCKRIVPWLAADRWSGKKIPIWWTGALTSSPSLYHGFPPCCSSSLRFLYFFPFLVSL